MNPNFTKIIIAAGLVASLDEIVQRTGMSKAAVSGCIGAMKKIGLVEYADKTVTLTEAGKQHLPVEETTEKKVSKADLAREILKRADVQEMLASSKRAEVKKLLMEEAGLTNNGAHTYIYNFQKAQRSVAGESVPALA
jgi:DNA-binding transcriptional regulator GbsR (MarR family)